MSEGFQIELDKEREMTDDVDFAEQVSIFKRTKRVHIRFRLPTSVPKRQADPQGWGGAALQ